MCRVRSKHHIRLYSGHSKGWTTVYLSVQYFCLPQSVSTDSGFGVWYQTRQPQCDDKTSGSSLVRLEIVPIVVFVFLFEEGV